MSLTLNSFGCVLRRAGSRLIALLLIFPWIIAGYAQAPDDLPNPNVGNPDNFVADPGGYLSPNTTNYVNQQLSKLRKNTTAEMAVAIVKSTGKLSIEDYAYQLFRHWGIGRADNNNGILLLVAVDDRKARIEVGSGVEGILPDIAAGNIIRRIISPAMKDGNINQGVSMAVDRVYDALTDESVREELRSEQPYGAMGHVMTLKRGMLLNFLYAVVGSILVFMVIMFFLDLARSRKRDNYRRAMMWYSHMPIYWLCAALSLGLGLPIAFIAWRLYRHSRDIPEICDSCGSKMNKLSEEEDNAFLSDSQDFEEKLGTVDYDVWLCPECGTVERFPYIERQLKYRKCPDCNTIAMNLVMDKVVEPPTTRKEGYGERIYQCQFCRNIRREGYRIPRKTDASAALAAGAAAGMLGGRGGGISGPSGGFGGGHSSGGGASGGW